MAKGTQKRSCDYGEANREMIQKLDRDFSEWRNEDFQRYIDRINNKLDRVWSKIEDLDNDLTGRPSWSITVIITMLSSIVVGLATASIMG